MRKTPYTLLTVSFIIVSLVGIMAFLPSPTIAETPVVPVTSEEDTAFIPTPQRADNEAIKAITRYIRPRIQENKKVDIIFKEDFEIKNFTTFFEDYRNAFGLRAGLDEMRLVKQDEKHIEYHQYYKGLQVTTGSYIIYKYKNTYRAKGIFVEELDIETSNVLSKKDVLQISKDTIKAEKYCWEDKELQKLRLKNNQDNCKPKITLLISKKNGGDNIAKNHSLNYRSVIISSKPFSTKYYVFVDAKVGDIVYFTDNFNHCHSGSVNTFHHGLQNITVKEINPKPYPQYGLLNECPVGVPKNEGWISTKPLSWWNNCSQYDSCLIVSTLPNDWSNFHHRKGASAQWALEQSQRYFYNNHGSYGSKKYKIIIESNRVGAASRKDPNDSTIAELLLSKTVGAVVPFIGSYNIHDENDLETIGHEFTHTIDGFAGTSLRETIGYNGFINNDLYTMTEAISDIFGALIMIDKFGQSSYDWKFGEMSTSTLKFQRSFINPNSLGYHIDSILGTVPLGQPDYYKQPQFYYYGQQTTTLIDGEFYINTGILNHWFYLLANGGNNDIWLDKNGDNIQNGNEPTQIFSVKHGIDTRDIAKILYQVFTGHPIDNGLSKDDSFHDFADKFVEKAMEMLSNGELSSNDKSIICRIIEAFNAVNLQPLYPEGECVLNVQEKNLKTVSDKNSCDCEVTLEICGAKDYTIEWFKIDNGVETPINPSDPEHVTNLCNYEYRYKVTDNDNNKCIINETINCKNTTTGQTIDNDPRHAPNNSNTNLAVTGNVNNCGATWAGDIDITVTGGTGTYTYLWSNGATTEDLTGVAPGSYTVTVTGGGVFGGVGSVVGGPFVISPLQVQGQKIHACGDDGLARVNLTVSGGTSPYSYLWSHGAPVKDITVLGSNLTTVGTGYSVTVTDAKGCTAIRHYLLKKYQPVINGTTTKACDYWQDGTISATASQGYPPYTFNWTSTTGVTAGNTTTLTGLAAGWYHATITDANGCNATEAFEVEVETPEQLPYLVPGQCVTREYCHGMSYGPTTDVSYSVTSFSLGNNPPNTIVCEERGACNHDASYNPYRGDGNLTHSFSAQAQTSFPQTTNDYLCIKTIYCSTLGGTQSDDMYGHGTPSFGRGFQYCYEDTTFNQICCKVLCDGEETTLYHCEDLVKSGTINNGVTKSFTAYPSPFKDFINIVFEAEEKTNATIKLTDGLGRLIQEDRIRTIDGENFHRINVSNYITNGLYFITVEISNQPALVQKIIRQE